MVVYTLARLIAANWEEGPSMRVGVQLVFQEHDDYNDTEMYRRELDLAVEAEAMGFDRIWPVEHHFGSYSMCPDNVLVLANLAGRTSRIGLGTAAIILPWNDPLRVVEKMILLDHLSDGRAVCGLGRGLARREFEGFQVEMSASREFFDQAAQVVVEGLEKGSVEAHSSLVTQPRVEIRPGPRGSFSDRTYMVTMSPESFEVAANLGIGSMMFSEMPWKKRAPQILAYREQFEDRHAGMTPLPVVVCDFIVCHADAAVAEERAVRHIGRYYRSLLEHYEMLNDHFERTGSSYLRYVEQSRAVRDVGEDKTTEAYIRANVWGTPEQIVQQLEARRELIGDFELAGCFSFASLPYDEVRTSMELFSREVLPYWQAV